jgi:hypothetical protein
MVIWYIFGPFGIFPRFGILYKERSGNTVRDIHFQKKSNDVANIVTAHPRPSKNELKRGLKTFVHDWFFPS